MLVSSTTYSEFVLSYFYAFQNAMVLHWSEPRHAIPMPGIMQLAIPFTWID